MKKGLLIFFITIIVSQYLFSAEEANEQEITIQMIKEKLAVKEVKTRNETFALIKEYGTDKFVGSLESEEEQLNVIASALWGGSITEASFVRAEILTLMLDSKSDKARTEAAKGLLRFAMYSDQPVASAKLVKMLESKDSDMRLTAVKTLSKMLKEPAKEPLGSIKIADLQESMLKYYNDENKEVLIAILNLFPKTNNPKTIEKIKSLVNHKEPEIRWFVFAFFSENEIKDEDLRKTAYKTIQDETQPPLPQRSATRYLGFLRDENASSLIVKLVKVYNEKEESKGNESIKSLKITSMRALTKIGNQEALKFLIEMVQADEPLEVIAEAGIGVQTITKQDFGYEPELVKSQSLIAEKKFKIWYLQNYLNEGDKKKDEIAQLKKDVEKLSKDLQTLIIIEKLRQPSIESKQKAIVSIHDAGIKRFVSDVMKSEDRLVIIDSIAFTFGDESFMKKSVPVMEAFLFEKDESALSSVIIFLGRASNFVNYDAVIPRLEELAKSKNVMVASAVNEALPSIKSQKAFNEKQKSIQKDKTKGKTPK